MSVLCRKKTMFVKKSDQKVHILWMIYVALRHPECTILHPHIQHFSGGACPRTPLVALRTFSARHQGYT